MYFTEEQKKAANREKFKRYYERNKEMLKQKQLEKYHENKEKISSERKKILEIYRMFKDGKLVEQI